MNRIAVLMVLCAVILALSTRAQPARVNSRGTPDSLDVLLLSTPAVNEVDVVGRRIHMEGGGTVSTLYVRALRDSVVVGARSFQSIHLTSERDISIAFGKRKRSVRGFVALRARQGSLIITARMATSDYLAGVIASEARAIDPREYLTALLVLQRNYVHSHRGRHAPYADVCDNTHCQLFHGVDVPPRMRALAIDSQRLGLSLDTSLPCYYSANCGGSSLTPGDIWGSFEPGYSRVRCDECRSSRWRRWSRIVRATPQSVALLGSARAAPFVDDDFKIRVGRALGFNTVPSNTVDRLERRGAVFHIGGRGFGHRIGLCQDGARELALRGKSARQILDRYFPLASVDSPASPTD